MKAVVNWQRVGGVVAWSLVVVLGAGGSWYAIDQAGGAVAPDATTLSPADLAPSPGPVPPASSTPTSPATVPTQKPTRGATQGASGRPTATASAAPPATWSGPAGVVVASCTGGVLRFESAQPADGWRVERDDDGDVNVTFERGEQEVRVRATCSGGTPQFDVRSKD